MRFCPNCNNLLQKNTELSDQKNVVTNLKFICSTCEWSEDASAEDTLMVNVSFREEQSLYKSDIYLNIASKDRIAPLVNKKCTACDNKIIKRIHLSSTGETVYVCPKCEHRFIEHN